MSAFPARDEALRFFDRLNQKYKDDGKRPAQTGLHVDPEGISVWYAEYLRRRVQGESAESAQAAIFRTIDRTPGFLPGGVPVAPSPPPGGRPINCTGPIGIRGFGYVDGAGAAVIPVACHWMEAFSAYVHCVRGTHHKGWTLDRWRDQLRAIAAVYPIIRSLDVLGYYEGGWYRREVTPIAFTSDGYLNGGRGRPVAATPDYYAHKLAFYRELSDAGVLNMDDRGDLNSWSNAEKRAHLRTNGRVLREAFGDELGARMAGLWAGNEGWQNGVETPELAFSMLLAFREGAGWWPAVRGSSWPPSWDPDDLKPWAESDSVTVHTIHPLREPGDVKRMLENYFSYAYGAHGGYIQPKPVWLTEPIGAGAGVSVGRIEDVEYLCALALVSAISGSAWTFMSGHGVFWDGPIEQEPGFREVPLALALLPTDVQHFDVVMHSGNRAGNPRFLEADDRVESRCDYALNDDGRFAGLCYAKHGVVPMRALRAFRATVYHPATRAIEWEGAVRAGDQLPLSGRIARLVIGQLQ